MKLYQLFALVIFLTIISCSKNKADNPNFSEKWELAEITNGWTHETVNAKESLGYNQTITAYKDNTFEKQRFGNGTDAKAKGKYTINKDIIMLTYDSPTSMRDGYSEPGTAESFVIDANRNLIYDRTALDGPKYKYTKIR